MRPKTKKPATCEMVNCYNKQAVLTEIKSNLATYGKLMVCDRCYQATKKLELITKKDTKAIIYFKIAGSLEWNYLNQTDSEWQYSTDEDRAFQFNLLELKKNTRDLRLDVLTEFLANKLELKNSDDLEKILVKEV